MPQQFQTASTFANSAIVSSAIVLTALMGLVNGCASPSTLSASPSVSPTQTAVATASPPPSPSLLPTASPAAAPSALALCAQQGTPCPVPAGTYSTAPFIHPFLVTIDAGWTNDRAWSHGGELARASGRGFLEWGSGFTGGVGPSGKQVTIGPTADDILKYIGSFKTFKISTPVPVTIGGRSGRSVDVATNGTSASAFLAIPEDAYNLSPGEKVRFMVFDVSGSAVTIMVEIPKEKDFDAEIAAMKPILDSIVWQ